MKVMKNGRIALTEEEMGIVGWEKEMIKDIDAMFKKHPDMKLYKTMTI